MAIIDATCPACGETFKATTLSANREAKCPGCGKSFRLEEKKPRKQKRIDVVVTDIRMPFWSMVAFMVQCVIAAIPALLILFVVGLICAMSFGSFFGALK